MENALNQCTAADGTSQIESDTTELGTVGQQELSQIEGDIRSGDSAFQSLSQAISQQVTLTAGLALPASLVSVKQEVLEALNMALGDATTGEGSTTMEQISTAAAALGDGLTAVSGQFTSLVTAMKS
jgi:hypothetical protein